MAAATPCGTNRCGNERKQLRKELERGRKNLIAYIGLECVVESLFGLDFVKKISPFKDEEEEEQICEDWKGEEKCLLCQARQQAVEDTIAQHQAYIDKLECGLTNGRAGRPEHTSHQQRLLRAEQWLAKSVNDIQTHEVEYGSDGEQNQPLDLSRQGYLDREAAIADGVLGPSNKQHMLKVPSVTVHRPSKNKMGRPTKGYGSASYTQDDLKLALQEVRSGKVGTRRAAMLFGIPRSTIRNHLNRHSFLVVEEDNDILDAQDVAEFGIRGKGGLDDEIGPDGKLMPNGRLLIQDEGEDIVARLRSFLVSRTIPVKHLDDDLESGVSQEILQDLVASYVRFSLVAGLDVDHLHQENITKTRQHEDSESKLPQHLLEALIHCHLSAEQSCAKVNGSCDPKALKTSIKQPRQQALPDLKIPLYKPMSSCSDNQDSDSDENKNDKLDSQDGVDLPSWQQGYGLSSSKPSSPQSSQRSGCSQDGSGKRPKRGRYRCYDRDCLMQAVNAVQRGEMTVTRAGNVFGVPHSTLEYKVKERHLKRLGKRIGSQKIKTEYDPGEPSSTQGLSASVYQQETQQMPAISAVHRPFESFAERLRAMSEKQAMHNNFSFLKQSLAGPQQQQQQQQHQQPTAYLAQTLLAPGLGISPELTDKCYVLDGQHAAALASHSLGLSKQWIGWPVHPAFKAAAYPHLKDGLNGTPAVLYAAPDLMGMRNSSVSDAINRLVEAQIYDSLYGGEPQPQTSRGAGKSESRSNQLESCIREALDARPSTSSVKQEPASPDGVRGYGSGEGSKKRSHLPDSEPPHSASKIARADQD
ncbi:uncharacterized protein LOC119739843 [Patiria miniata]|uniref:HTH psq-type domain-containing protein n=1 Tax=Patiria miniata TaxID=46514 RepID=A0A914B5Y4_PATMI|nr:uncharacterized protein LOC119739843 [Patiria miniata]